MDPEGGPPELRRWHMGPVEDEGDNGFRMMPVLGHLHGLRIVERTGPPLPPGFVAPEGDPAELWDVHASAEDNPDLPPGFAREVREPWEDARSSAEEGAPFGGASGSVADLPPGFHREPDDWSSGGIA